MNETLGRWPAVLSSAVECRRAAPRSSNGMGSQLERPASIFEKSRMSLMIAQQRLAAAAQDVEQLFCSAIRRHRAQQIRDAQHAVHRRADLVAHHREEGGLGAVRGLGGGGVALGLRARLAHLLHDRGGELAEPVRDDTRRRWTAANTTAAPCESTAHGGHACRRACRAPCRGRTSRRRAAAVANGCGGAQVAVAIVEPRLGVRVLDAFAEGALRTQRPARRTAS